MQARAVAARRGWSWFIGGWRIFLYAPLVWVLLGLLLLFIMFVALLVPVVGRLAFVFVSPVLGAGLLFAAREAAASRPVRVSYLWEGFRQSTIRDRLIMLALVAVVGAGVTSLLASLLIPEAMLAMAGQPGAVMPPMDEEFWLRFVIVLTPQLLAAVALSYAIPLVMFRQAPVVQAMRASLAASGRNLFALLLFGVVYFGAAFLASIPVGLGWLFLLPASAGMLYCSYSDMFDPG